MADEDVERSEKWLFDFTKLRKITENIDPENYVVPVVVQDANTKEVLILAYVNQQALEMTMETGLATFWSTSRNELWIKGKKSGDTLLLKEVRVNCEQNSLLYLVEPAQGGACHVVDKNGLSMTGCYYRKVNYNAEDKSFSLEALPDKEL
jgi:phosphoribosyl-AMP cyclohydrolase